jgi:transposase-like protein
MARRERRRFSDEHKAEVVALVRSSGKSIGEISRDLDLTDTAVREWVQSADVGGGKGNGLTTAEREELSRLRRQVRALEEERSILKSSATFFAEETIAEASDRAGRRIGV